MLMTTKAESGSTRTEIVLRSPMTSAGEQPIQEAGTVVSDLFVDYLPEDWQKVADDFNRTLVDPTKIENCPDALALPKNDPQLVPSLAEVERLIGTYFGCSVTAIDIDELLKDHNVGTILKFLEYHKAPDMGNPRGSVEDAKQSFTNMTKADGFRMRAVMACYILGIERYLHSTCPVGTKSFILFKLINKWATDNSLKDLERFNPSSVEKSDIQAYMAKILDTLWNEDNGYAMAMVRQENDRQFLVPTGYGTL